ncbi:MAG: DNA mismatch repair protein MutS, partial [Holosporaceae bacterium]|nr:DNA mismatch repair protein MutS [Holosporaceae bacterium]
MEENSLFYCASKESTPMMTQYLSIKSQYPGCLLLFRMGDFYEMFFDDAKIAAPVLNIALTSRGKHLDSDIPMCGVPVATLENYLGRLVKYGYKVAICEQMEDPKEAKKRGYKAIVKREITRIITPGTIIEDSLLNACANNFLMSVVPDICKKTSKIKTVSFAAIDISTGDFFVNTVLSEEFSAVIEMYHPKEILVPSCYEQSDFVVFISTLTNASITHLPDSKFNPIVEEDRLKKYFKVRALDGFGISSANELSTCGSVLEYLIITQRNDL